MSRAALEPGQVLDETYRIVRRIGEGGMGEVYEVAHARLAGRYAVKLLQKEVAEDPGLLARFQREAEVTSSLRHPNIVQVVDFRRLPAGTSYIVMEYLDGVDLAAEIRRVGALPLERVASLVEQIATGLAAAHEQGIVHRDLKPANLFLIVLPGSRREMVKIVDFGISKVRGADTQLTRTATVMGTPQYMAPEQALGQSDRIDARADQFALATITYEMLAGRCAFAGDTIPTVLYQLVHVDPPPLSVGGHPAHPALDAVVRRGLAKQPEARFPNVLEFAQAFGAAVAQALAGGGGPAVASTMAAAQTALAPSAPSSPSSPSSPREALTTLGASASEAPGRPAAATSRTVGDGAAPAAGRRKVKSTVVVGGAAAAALGVVIVLVASRGRAPQTRGPGAPDVPVAPGSPIAVGAPAARAVAGAPSSGAPAAPPAAPAAAGADDVTISIADGPRDLVVSVDGHSARRPPVRLLRDSGKHALRFEAPGYRSRTMQLDSRRDVALVVSLKRKGGEGAVPAVTPAAAPAAPTAPAPQVPPTGDPRAASAYVPPSTTTPTPPSSSPPPPPPPEKRKAGRFRHGVDAVSDFAKRHFGTAGSK